MFYYQVIPLKRMPRGIEAFTYAHTSDDLSIGDLVEIPIKKSTAFGIVSSTPVVEQPTYDVRNIQSLYCKCLLSEDDIMIARNIAMDLCAPLSSIVKKMLPPLQKRKLKKIGLHHVREQKSSSVFQKTYVQFASNIERISTIESSLKQKGTVWLFPTIKELQSAYNSVSDEHKSQICVFHSDLSTKEQFDYWFSISRGEVHTLFTTRSGLFIPNGNISSLYIDHEASPHHHQDDSSPKFSNKTIAESIAIEKKIPLSLCGFSPSGQTYFEIHKNQCAISAEPFTLPNISKVVISDASASYQHGKILSQIEQRIASSTGICAIILNKKGYSTGMICESCQFTFICPTCRMPLTYHKKKSVLECKYCHYSIGTKTRCPKCSSSEKFSYGLGVEQLFEQMSALVKSTNRPIICIDGDSQRDKESIPNNAIIVGTKSAIPLLDWEKVSMLVLPGLDQQLQIPEYTVTEQVLFDLFYFQAMLPETATMYIQTIQPTHLVYKKLLEPDYIFRMDLNLRMALLYPPYSTLVKITCSHRQKKNACYLAEAAASLLKKRLTDNKISAKISQPISLQPEWFKGKYHYAILVRVAPADRLALLSFLQEHSESLWNIEVMPNHIMNV